MRKASERYSIAEYLQAGIITLTFKVSSYSFRRAMDERTSVEHIFLPPPVEYMVDRVVGIAMDGVCDYILGEKVVGGHTWLALPFSDSDDL